MLEHDSTLNIEEIITIDTKTYALQRKTWKKYEKCFEKLIKQLIKNSINNEKRGK